MRRQWLAACALVLVCASPDASEEEQNNPGSTRTLSSVEYDSEPAPTLASPLDHYCTKTRKSRDAIIYLGQKQHTTYDATHANTLNASMASLLENYAAISGTDVIVWHEGDLTSADANALEGATNVRFCLLVNETGWGVPSWVNTKKLPYMPWSIGYRSMIRFYAVTVWPTLQSLGYEWVMRMDDDSFILSPIHTSIFDTMRASGKQYAYRMLSAECPHRFNQFVTQYVRGAAGGGRKAGSGWGFSPAYAEELRARGVDVDYLEFCATLPRHCRAPAKKQRVLDEIAKLGLAGQATLTSSSIANGMPYCGGIGQYGYYNNWFVTEVKWWIETPEVKKMITEFDRSSLIWTHRLNDLIFQTAAIKLYMPPKNRVRLIDFTYQHHTMRHGRVNFGGIESGTNDPHARDRLLEYAKNFGGKLQRCRVQTEAGNSPLRMIYYVNPGMSRSSAPACGRDGTLPFS